MRTKTTPIDNRLDPYGRPQCGICGQPKERSYRDDVSRESVFAGERYQLTCRNHPGHPLFNPESIDTSVVVECSGPGTLCGVHGMKHRELVSA